MAQFICPWSYQGCQGFPVTYSLDQPSERWSYTMLHPQRKGVLSNTYCTAFLCRITFHVGHCASTLRKDEKRGLSMELRNVTDTSIKELRDTPCRTTEHGIWAASLSTNIEVGARTWGHIATAETMSVSPFLYRADHGDNFGLHQ